jgi:hypothetical protein
VCVCVGGGGAGSSVSTVTRRLENLDSILRHIGDLSAHHGVQTGSDFHLRYVLLRNPRYIFPNRLQAVCNKSARNVHGFNSSIQRKLVSSVSW